MNRRASVLWMPPSARHFSRVHRPQEDGFPFPRNFSIPTIGRIAAKQKIKAKLIADLDSEEWELPPKPKSMRSRTYTMDRVEQSESVLRPLEDENCGGDGQIPWKMNFV